MKARQNHVLGVDAILALTALLSLAAVAAALVSQYVFEMRPCPWCILQRVIFLGAAATAITGLLWRSAMGRLFAAGLMLVWAACGMTAALWQHFVAAASASCKQSLADVIIGSLGLDALSPELFAPRASCADARVELLGLPYEYYSLALFALLAFAAVRIMIVRD
jgi:disulfide bond formation protein DsbB